MDDAAETDKQQAVAPIAPADTTGAYKVAGMWIKAKKSFEFNDSAWLSVDTLFLVTCAKYVYYPFGPIEDQSALSKSLLKDFNVAEVLRYSEGDVTKYHKLIRGRNKLLLFFSHDDNPDAYWGSYIVKGKLHDSNMELSNNIKIGMTTSQFYSAFFERFDNSLRAKVRFVVFEPCVDGNPKHVYTFDNGKLSAIEFDCVECEGQTVEY